MRTEDRVGSLLPVFEPTLLVFLCNWCSYEGADAAGKGGLEFPSCNLREIRVMCSGRVDPRFIMEALTTGADGVLVLGCVPGDCHYKTGNVEALRRMLLLERILQQYGIQKARIQFDCVSAGEGEKYARIAVDMIERLKGFGPLNYVCKA